METVAALPAAEASGAGLDAQAFRRLYPELYLQRFLDDGIRPDGRTLGRARSCTIGLGTITSVDGSALVKQGNTTVLAGIRSNLERPMDTSPDRGSLALNVELAPFSSAEWRPGRAPELISTVSDRLGRLLLGSNGASSTAAAAAGCTSTGVFPLRQLCVAESKAAWSLSLDIYILNADGAVFDTVLLAAVAALAGTQLPPTVTTPEGEVRRRRLPATGEPTGPSPSESDSSSDGVALIIDTVPLALTCALYRGHVLVDPTAEEEALAESLVTVVVDKGGKLHGIFKPGGNRGASHTEVLRCVESAKLRYKEVSELMDQSLAEHRHSQMDTD